MTGNKVYLYANKKRTYLTAVLLTNTNQPLKFWENVVFDSEWRLGEVCAEALRGMPAVAPANDHYPTQSGGITSPTGHFWELDADMDKLAIIWCKGV